MDTSSQIGDDSLAVARRIQALIDKGESVGSFESSAALTECVSVLQELWEDASRPRAEDSRSDLEDPAASWPRRFGRFELRGLLGSGGFGIVLLAYDEMLDREVALKLPRPELILASQVRSRFLREAKSAALLDHPAIVPIFDAGEVGPLWYIAAGYVKGPSLARWLQDNPSPVSARTAAVILLSIAEAVQHAHSRGILHRDLKPSNVLLEPRVPAGASEPPFMPRLSDFGLAKRLEGDDDQTVSGMLVGTPRYMAPEQAANRYREVGVTTDVYGLGAILHELLTGQPPFVGESNSEVLHQIQHANLSPARLRASHVPRDLETVCLKCLEKEPDRRYQSAGELADDLQRLLAGEPVAARPVGRAARWARWCRRRPVLAALSLGFVVAVTLGSTVASWQWYRAERHLADAEMQARRAEANFARAEDTLLDLAWIVEESALWAPESNVFAETVAPRLRAYVERGDTQADSAIEDTAILAACRTFEARRATIAGDFQEADLSFRAALDAWRHLVALHPENESYRRAMSLCLFSFSQFERDRPREAGSPDPRRILLDFYHNVAKDTRIRGWSLRDYAGLLLNRGDLMFKSGRVRDAAKAFDMGLIAMEVLLEAPSPDAKALCLHGQLSLRLAKEQRRLGEGASTDIAARAAIQSLERAVELVPSERLYRSELADAYRFLAVAQRSRRSAEARELLSRAVPLLEGLVEEEPGEPTMRLRLGKCYRDLAFAQTRAGNDQEALDCFTRGREVWYPLRDCPDPLLPEERLELGWACHQEGKLAQGLNHPQIARAAFEAGIEMFRRPLREDERPARHKAINPRLLIARAECHFYLARHQLAAGEKQAAIDNFRFAVDLLSPQVQGGTSDAGMKDIWRNASTESAKLIDARDASPVQYEE